MLKIGQLPMPDIWPPEEDPRPDEAGAAWLRLSKRLVQPRLNTAWRVYSFGSIVTVGGKHVISVRPHQPFCASWFVVSTPGFQIHSLTLGHRYIVLDEVDGDLFLYSEWDKLHSHDQLDRVKIPQMTCGYGEEFQLTVSARPRLVTFRNEKRPFRAMLLGEELTSRNV